MQEDSTEANNTTEKENKLCRNCKTKEYLEGYPSPLCSDCRQLYIHYPIPRWIKLFALGVLLIMFLGLIRLPSYLHAAIHLSRAEKAMNTNHYLTAERELGIVLQYFPNHLQSNGRMIVACVYNGHFSSLEKPYEKLVNKNLNDQDLVWQINNATKNLELYIIQDSTLNNKIETIKYEPEKLKNLFKNLDSVDCPDILAAGTEIADKLYDLNDFKGSEMILDKLLIRKKDYRGAISLMSSVKRKLGKYDEAITLCDQLLQMNCEDVAAISHKVRIELKRKNDAQATKYADEAMKIDSKNIFAMEAMAMIDYYADRKAESTKLLSSIKHEEAITGDSIISNRLALVLSGKELFR